jgi:hypothetical protein
VEAAGIEHVPEISEKGVVSSQGAAESGAVAARNLEMDADLAAIITAWPTLSKVTRRVIIRLIEADWVEKDDSP